jgi:hypothetical protein
MNESFYTSPEASIVRDEEPALWEIHLFPSAVFSGKGIFEWRTITQHE